MSATAIGPITAQQINRNLYVGQSDLNNIQEAVDFARETGLVYTVVIPDSYAGVDQITNVAGGTGAIVVLDMRFAQWQSYVWSGPLSQYIPAGFAQLGPITAVGNIISQSRIKAYGWGGVPDVSASNANMGTGNNGITPLLSLINASEPVDQRIWTIAVHPGQLAFSAVTDDGEDFWWMWALRSGSDVTLVNFVPPVTMQGTLDVTGIITSDGSPVLTEANSGGGGGDMVYPGSGVAVSIGTAWGTSINPADIPRLSTPNTFVQGMIVDGNFIAAGNYPFGPLGVADVEQPGVQLGLRYDGLGSRIALVNPDAPSDSPPTPRSKRRKRAGARIADAHLWTIEGFTGAMQFCAYSDDQTVKNVWMVANRTGATVTTVEWAPTQGAGLSGIGNVLSVGMAPGTMPSNDPSISGGSFQPRLQLGISGTNGLAYGGMFEVGTNNSNYVGSQQNDRLNIRHNTYGGDGLSSTLWYINAAGLMYSEGGVASGPMTKPSINSAAFVSFFYNDLSNGYLTGICSSGDQYGRGAIELAGVGQTNFPYLAFATFTDSGTTFHADVNITGAVNVSGAKNFRIPYPLDDKLLLTHSSLEGPECAVFYRGEAVVTGGTVEVTLPVYFEALTRRENRSVLLTQIVEDNEDTAFAKLMASRVKDGKFTILSDIEGATVQWEVKAVRGDIQTLQVLAPKPRPIVVSQASRERYEKEQRKRRANRTGEGEAGELQPKT